MRARMCRGAVLISHGAGEHCDWYDELAEQLSAAGLVVFAHDHGTPPP